MLELLGAGLATIVQAKYLLPLFLGTLAGIVGGSLPGVTITMTIIVVLPPFVTAGGMPLVTSGSICLMVTWRLPGTVTSWPAPWPLTSALGLSTRRYSAGRS